jgi:hypothetical protein
MAGALERIISDIGWALAVTPTEEEEEEVERLEIGPAEQVFGEEAEEDELPLGVPRLRAAREKMGKKSTVQFSMGCCKFCSTAERGQRKRCLSSLLKLSALVVLYMSAQF